jgi:2-keto-3-deoxy-galactonokinase
MFPDVTSLPVFLIPGVSTGARGAEPWDAGTLDIIRGEETLCVGLLEAGILHPGATLLNLGSHWKAIVIDDEGRIEKSFTDLSGELMLAAQAHTVLASAVPVERSLGFDPEWVLHGVRAERKSGLSRALYSVRMLDLGAQTSALERVSYLTGSFISHTLTQLVAKSFVCDHAVVCGATGIVEAWKLALTDQGIDVTDYAEGTEAAFIRGLIELSQPVIQQV